MGDRRRGRILVLTRAPRPAPRSIATGLVVDACMGMLDPQSQAMASDR